MEDYRILIADDEEGMRTVMQKIISRADGFSLVGEAANGKEALDLAEKLQPDVVFLDVEMPVMTGIECARSLQDLNPEMIIIFATAHDGYMSEAFELYAFDYLLKPFKVDRVLQTLARIRERLSAKYDQSEKLHIKKDLKPAEGKLMLKQKDGMVFLNLKDVLLIQREDRSTVIYTANGEHYVSSDTLTEMDERLPDEMFFRCHKSYIINLNAIQDITPYGRWTYVVRLNGITQDALITHDKYEELTKMFC